MLVAMAVVAVLSWLNRPVPYFIHSEIGGMTSIGDSQGWPICFRPFRWRVISIILTPSAEPRANVASPTRNVLQEIIWLPLLVDIVLAAMLVTVAVIVVGLFGKKKVPCPSPST